MSHWDAKGFWMRDNIHWPRPVHPLFVSYGLIPIEVGSARAYEEWSMPSLKYAYLVLHGYVFQRIEPIGGDAPPIMERFPLLFHLWRINPLLRSRVLGFGQFIKEKGFEKHAHDWREVWEPEAQRRLEPIRGFNRANASMEEIANHLEQLYDFLCWAWNPHCKIVMLGMYIRGRWLEICEKLLNLTEYEAFELVQINDPAVLNTMNRLLTLARRAAADQTVSEILSLPSEKALQGLSHTWFQKELDQFLESEGDRPADSFEFTPTWREMPEIVVGIIKGLMDSDNSITEDSEFQAYRQQRIKELRSTLKGKERKDFDAWLELAEEAQPLSEIHDYILLTVPLSLTRYAAIEAGRRFVKQNILDSPDDIFFLYREELLSALRKNYDHASLNGLVAERKAEHCKNFSLVPPQTIGKIPIAPPFHVFPPIAAEGMKIFVKQYSLLEAQQGVSLELSPEGELLGIPGSPGVAEGSVRIIHTAEEFSLVQDGEVLVCPFTTPTWTVLFPKLAALVTDSGGALSHAAIVSREYRLPSIVGTIKATKTLHNGQRVRVDGTAGKLQVLD
ncbi:phosphoenolpyruvate synthase/pyruvate phosphate dikinase [Desulfosporosinus acidiphilus SJ4]|uniref:Phosphoenolpyruvate synthase/pyruvate phosphate dikinase n=1 Tax=Desulfosporosinus acidiphilus (strain DSM 22704 / JCM 16185 / SJ4) TaxID=646529 RepID=I4D5K3_DESAJ|nr:PEP-utilizing enzyme [Desulfosporosinus acidiphilus]AFM41077.1 phosphoenolpyruvate synthase/pyruvate phosphate dikinase [Desulfosporosinus acidiphilus SJ4]